MASRPGDFGYTPTPVVTDAPQIGGAISPVRVDPRDMDNLGQAMVAVGQGAQAYGDAGVDKIKRGIDLAKAVDIRAEHRQGFSRLYVDFKGSLAGDKTSDEAWQEFTDKAYKLHQQVLRGTKNEVQQNAAEKSYLEALNSYSPMVRTDALKAYETRQEITLRDEITGILSNVYGYISSGNQEWKDAMIRGAADIDRAIDARIAVGYITPLRGMQLKQEKKQQYFTDIVRNLMLDEKTFDATLGEWRRNTPIIQQKDEQGNVIASASWRDLAGEKAIPAIEQYSQRLLEIRIRRDAMEADKQARREEKLERDADRTADKEFKRLSGVLHNTDEGKQAAKVIDQQVDPKRDPEANTTLRQQVIDEYVANGGRRSILGITRDKLNPGRDKSQPPDFRGSANDAAQLDRYAQTLRSQVGKVPQDVLEKRIEWLENRRAALRSLGNERRFMVNPPR